MPDQEPQVRINISLDSTQDQEKVVLKCAHCKLPHMVSKAYRDQYEKKRQEICAFNKVNLTIDQVWMCGGCFKAYHDLPNLKVDCNHEVPPFPEPAL